MTNSTKQTILGTFAADVFQNFIRSATKELFVIRTCVSETLTQLPASVFDRSLKSGSLKRATFIVPTIGNASVIERISYFPNNHDAMERWVEHRQNWISSIKRMQERFKVNGARIKLLVSDGPFTYNMYADENRILLGPLWASALAIDTPHIGIDRKKYSKLFDSEIAIHEQRARSIL